MYSCKCNTNKFFADPYSSCVSLSFVCQLNLCKCNTLILASEYKYFVLFNLLPCSVVIIPQVTLEQLYLAVNLLMMVQKLQILVWIVSNVTNHLRLFMNMLVIFLSFCWFEKCFHYFLSSWSLSLSLSVVVMTCWPCILKYLHSSPRQPCCSKC